MGVASQERVHRLLTEAIAAVRSHEIPRARLLLNEILKEDSRNEHALLWVAAIADDAREGKHILQRVLDINPSNEQAKHALRCLRERTGELPIPSIPPPGAAGSIMTAGTTRVSAPAPPPERPKPAPDDEPADTGTWRRVLRDETIRPSDSPDSQYDCSFCTGRLDRETYRCDRCRAICSFDNLKSFPTNGDIEEPLIERSVTTWIDVAKYKPTAELHYSIALGCMNLTRSAEGYMHLIQSLELDPAQADVRQAVDALKSRRLVLVLDHSTTARKLVCGLLDKNDYLVKSATKAAEALAFVDDVTPDLIYMDLSIPDMPGLDLVRDFRSRPELAHIPILAVSHVHGFVDRMKVKVAGGSAFLAKPFQSPELLKEVEKLTKPWKQPKEKAERPGGRGPIDKRLHQH